MPFLNIWMGVALGLNEVASAVKPRPTRRCRWSGPECTGLNEVASAVKPRLTRCRCVASRRDASTKLPRQLSRGRPQCVLGAPLLSGLNEVASAVKPRLEESLGRVASWRQASTKLPRQLSRGRDRLGASAERRVAASTKLPRQLSRGEGEACAGGKGGKCLNEVASAVKPRPATISWMAELASPPQRSCLGS